VNGHKKFSSPAQPCGEDATVQQLQQENRRLREQLRRAETEREILKKAAVYFASQNP
jgi:transposase